MISGHTRLAAVFATPIKHSISPLIHNTAFKALGIDAVYLAFEVGPADLPAAFETIKTFEMLGVNLSMPNKQVGYQLVDEASEVSHLLETINTVVHQDGRLIGHNTDGIGFIRSLADEGVDIRHKKMTILGSGGAALAIIAQASLDGIKEIVVFKRAGPSYQPTAAKLAVIAEKTNCQITLLPLEDQPELTRQLATSDLLVNATNIGMSPDIDVSLIEDGSWLRPELVVADIIYQPRETKLLKIAKKQGCQTVNGLGMLLHQGAVAFELWTGKSMPVEKVRSVLKNR